MATLHLIGAPPDGSAALSNCLRAATPGDAVLLIGNGVLCAIATAFTRATARTAGLSWYVLSEDVASRGIGNLIATSVRQVDDAAFVDLVAMHQPIVSWS
jgi:tRNA 2-thiouridine synthesizing protein B